MKELNKQQWIGVGLALVVVMYFFFFTNQKPTSVVKEAENTNTVSSERTQKQEEPKIINNVNKQTMENELKIDITKEGSGEQAVVGSIVSVHYTGKLVDGTVFDSSIPRGRAFEFRLGEGRVIAGWEEGIKGMKVGEKRTLTIPGNMAYGSQGVQNPGSEGYLIPPNATLVFDVELLTVK